MRQEKEEIEHKKKNKAIYDFVSSDGWKYVKGQMLDTISDLQSIMNIESIDPEAVSREIQVRKNVIDILKEWLESIEGQANQYELNEFSLDESEYMHIVRREEE